MPAWANATVALAFSPEPSSFKTSPTPKRWCSILHPSRREEEEDDAGLGEDDDDAADAGFNDEENDAADAGFNDEENEAADAVGFGFGDV